MLRRRILRVMRANKHYLNSIVRANKLQTSIILILQAERGFAAWAVFVGRTVVFVRGKGKGA